jgi:hypothetical protein
MWTKEQQIAATNAAAFEREVAAGVESIYQAFPNILRCEGSRKGIISLCAEFHGTTEIAPDLDTFKNIVANSPDCLNEVVQRPVETIKQAYITEYIELLSAHSRQDKFSLQGERKRLQHLPLEACRQKLEELKRRQGMSSASVSELKTFVRESTQGASFQGYPILPPSLWNTESGRHVALDATYLNGLITADLWSFKRLVKLYGSRQVDQRRGIK